MSINFDCSKLEQGLTDYERRAKKAVQAYGNTAGKKMEAVAKKDAPWEDRTALARQTIEGGADVVGDSTYIYVAGHRKYSPYLEFCNEKKYAVLWPTVEKLAPEILRGMDKLLEKK